MIPALAAAYLCLNLVSAAFFTQDKWNAGRDAWRVPEKTLLGLAFLGPFGAFAAMRVFHHKTRKTKFLLVPLFIVIHLVILAYLLLTFL